MGLSSALSIGRSALAAYQAALRVVGNNVANAANPGFTRVSPNLSAVAGPAGTVGQTGLGVVLDSTRRNVIEALQARLRTALSDRESAQTTRSGFSRLEGIHDPLGEFHLGSLMNNFFSALQNLQNDPQNAATRRIVLDHASALARKFQGVRSELVKWQTDINAEIESGVRRADELATRIAGLNTTISAAEAGGGGQASALRDQRERLLGELSALLDVTVREQPSGVVNVFVGNQSLVQFGTSFGLTTTSEIDANGLLRTTVRIAFDNGALSPGAGRIGGLIALQNNQVAGQLDRLDALAGALVNEVNRIHSGGKGLIGYSSLRGFTAVSDPSLSLAAPDNGVDFLPRTGSFFIDVKDTASGAVVRHQVNVDLDGIGADTTLNSLAADITAGVPGVTATVLPDGRLQLDAAAGVTFSFADDTSGVLAALGVNVLFTGSDSLDIGVNLVLVADPRLLAAGRTDLPGDGANATAMAALADQPLASLGGVSLNEHYAVTMAALAVASAGAGSSLEATSVIFDALTTQREAVSGVNIDEEAIAMISYQRAYEGAARYVQVVNEMMQTMLNMVR